MKVHRICTIAAVALAATGAFAEPASPLTRQQFGDAFRSR